MKESTLRRTIFIIVIAAHMFTIIETLIFYFLEGFLFEEMTTTLAIAIPIFGTHTAIIIKNVLANKISKKAKDPTVSPEYKLVSLIIPTIFTLLILSSISLKVYNIGFSSFEEFKAVILLLESIFGLYVGLIVTSLISTNTQVTE